MKITFEKGLAERVLVGFNKSVDDSGYIVDNQSGKRVLSPDGEEIKLSEFAGIVPGSEVFIKSDIVSLIKYLDWSKNHDLEMA